jgi:hypothetical protein
MDSKLNFRSVIFKMAYIIVKKTWCSFSSALTQAWKRHRDFKSKTIVELTNRINGFDFYYQMSDHGSTYRH